MLMLLKAEQWVVMGRICCVQNLLDLSWLCTWLWFVCQNISRLLWMVLSSKKWWALASSPAIAQVLPFYCYVLLFVRPCWLLSAICTLVKGMSLALFDLLQGGDFLPLWYLCTHFHWPIIGGLSQRHTSYTVSLFSSYSCWTEASLLLWIAVFLLKRS